MGAGNLSIVDVQLLSQTQQTRTNN